MNWRLVGVLAALFGIGVLNLYSASGVRLGDGVQVENFYQKQLIWGAIGVFGMAAFMTFDYRRLNALAWPMYIVTIVLLRAVPLLGKTVMGARRWLDFGVFSFQPSELAKFAVLLLGARLLSGSNERLNMKELGTVLGLGALPALLIIKQPDLGTGMLVLLLLGGLILYRGIVPWLFRTLCVLVPTITPLFWFVLKDYQKRRILAFLDPATDPLGSGYHILQSEIAVGSGRLFGKGFLAGTQSQLRFLPEKHTDFAVAVFGEEWGFFGMIVMPSYTITVNGLEISFKTDADEPRIQAAQALLEERFAELSKGGRYISREKLLTLLALGMADDYLEVRRKQAGLEARMQELLERR